MEREKAGERIERGSKERRTIEIRLTPTNCQECESLIFVPKTFVSKIGENF